MFEKRQIAQKYHIGAKIECKGQQNGYMYESRNFLNVHWSGTDITRLKEDLEPLSGSAVGDAGSTRTSNVVVTVANGPSTQ